MEQVRGPYERPLGETLSLAAGNVQLNLRQYLVNHFVLAPVLIWVGHTPVRQADAVHLPASGRYAIWGAELALLGLALWQAARELAPLARQGQKSLKREGISDGRSGVAPAMQQTSSACADAAGLRRDECWTPERDQSWPAVVLAMSFLASVAFLTVVHILIAVDERFTTPALPLIGVFAAGRLSELVHARRSAAVRLAA